MKVATVCTGIGSPEMALRNLGVPHDISFACEIDKYARETYLANFEPRMMLTDMTKETWEGEEFYADLFIGGIPCQAFSLAGKRLGELDPRGLLFYDFYRYVKIQQPKYFIIENVKGLLSDNGGKTFQNWLDLLGQSVNGNPFVFPHEDSLMYNLHWQVLNTKDYGIPQNRERVFLVGIRNDLPNDFVFPRTIPLELRLKDLLEENVDEKYYLSEKMLEFFTKHNEKNSAKGNGFKFSPKTDDKIADTITARCFKMGADDNYIEVFCDSGKGRTIEKREILAPLRANTAAGFGNFVKIPEPTKKGYTEAHEGDSINLAVPTSKTRRGRVGKQVAQTLDTHCNQAVIEPKIARMQGRNPENPKSRKSGLPTEQMLEINENGTSNCLTSVQKDNLVVEKVIQLNPSKESGGTQPYQHNRVYDANGLMSTLDTESGRKNILSGFRIRKLTPLETARLQGFPDDFVWTVSNSQRYKQCGNSITVNVIQAILKNLLKP